MAGLVLLSYIEGNVQFSGFQQVIDRKAQLEVDGRFWKSIIRPTSGAVETENSLVNKELRGFRQWLRFGSSKPEGVGRAVCFRLIDGSIFSVESGEKEVLTAASNAVEFASR